jgi:two-component system, NtrC family, nitrogen regulation sensor histidine kinase NtrY
MGFRDFRFRVALRVILLSMTVALVVWMAGKETMQFSALFLGAIGCLQLWEMYRFVAQTNRKLARFLESIRYSDFASGFTADNHLGESFRELNRSIYEVMEAFRTTRSEKEEQAHYLHTMVEHVGTGIISFDMDGRVGLMNATAKRFLQTGQLHSIDELIHKRPKVYKALFDLKPGKSSILQIDKDTQLSIQATELKLREATYKLVALQNIKPELQQKELEAWQNLTKVLRHEIMNSMTPIASLTSTLRSIIEEDIHAENGHWVLEKEGMDDLKEGIQTIESRSQGLIRFIDAYRDYTSIPEPDIKVLLVKELLDTVMQLMRPEARKKQVAITCSVYPPNLRIEADAKLIEQVLINLVKNALEAVEGRDGAQVELMAEFDEMLHPVIRVEDNGPGIIREAIERIFIPFFTTKKSGSGIGLALSRQIMQMHHGSLSVTSEPEVRTVFCLRF